MRGMPSRFWCSRARKELLCNPEAARGAGVTARAPGLKQPATEVGASGAAAGLRGGGTDARTEQGVARLGEAKPAERLTGVGEAAVLVVVTGRGGRPRLGEAKPGTRPQGCGDAAGKPGARLTGCGDADAKRGSGTGRALAGTAFVTFGSASASRASRESSEPLDVRFRLR